MKFCHPDALSQHDLIGLVRDHKRRSDISVSDRTSLLFPSLLVVRSIYSIFPSVLKPSSTRITNWPWPFLLGFSYNFNMPCNRFIQSFTKVSRSCFAQISALIYAFVPTQAL